MKNFILAAFLLVLMLTVADVSAQKTKSVSQANVTPVSSVDLKQYSGKWYEIARYQNKFQKNCVGNTTATFSMKEEGKFEILNECLRKNGTIIGAKGEGKIVDKNSNAKLEVRFAPGYLAFLSSSWDNYWIIDLDPKYQYTVVGDPKRENLWILSRSPEMKVATYQNILRRLETMGYKPGKLVKTPQNVEVVKGAVIQKQ